MTAKIEPRQLMEFVFHLHDMLDDPDEVLAFEERQRCQRWIDAVLPPEAEAEAEAEADLNDESADSWVEKLCDFYHGCDYVEDALAIAKIVACSDSQDENTAEHLLNSVGYTLGMLLHWKLSPELHARATQIRSIALPGIDDEVEVAE